MTTVYEIYIDSVIYNDKGVNYSITNDKDDFQRSIVIVAAHLTALFCLPSEGSDNAPDTVSPASGR